MYESLIDSWRKFRETLKSIVTSHMNCLPLTKTFPNRYTSKTLYDLSNTPKDSDTMVYAEIK